MNLPPVDTTKELPPTTGNTFIYGMVLVSDANYSAEPGRFKVEVNLGTTFDQEPVVLLTRKLYRDDSREILDTGDHTYSYHWVDPVNFSKFEVWVNSTRLNYPPAFSYEVVGNVGFLRRLMSFIFG